MGKSFELGQYSDRVRSRLMAPAIWQDFTSGDRELSEYIFVCSIQRWVQRPKVN